MPHLNRYLKTSHYHKGPVSSLLMSEDKGRNTSCIHAFILHDSRAQVRATTNWWLAWRFEDWSNSCCSGMKLLLGQTCRNGGGRPGSIYHERGKGPLTERMHFIERVVGLQLHKHSALWHLDRCYEKATTTWEVLGLRLLGNGMKYCCWCFFLLQIVPLSATLGPSKAFQVTF